MKSKDGSEVVAVVVKTRARLSQVHVTDDVLQVAVKTAPTQGKANGEVIKLVADYLGVKRNAVVLLSGEKSRRKRLGIKR